MWSYRLAEHLSHPHRSLETHAAEECEVRQQAQGSTDIVRRARANRVLTGSDEPPYEILPELLRLGGWRQEPKEDVAGGGWSRHRIGPQFGVRRYRGPWMRASVGRDV